MATYDMDWIGANSGAMDPYLMPALHFHLSDPLGTRRVQTNPNGQIESFFESLPFGDGFQANFEDLYTLNPATALSTADDATENHFTGKERDAESGNDYFDARYFGSSMGRFLSPDPSGLFYADPTNPQSLNLYSYAQNNPLKNIDPTGLDCATQNADNTVSYNAGDCENGSQGGDANKEYYIDCDGCTSGAAGATLDSATGALYATDANGNAIAGTTVQGWADPQGVSTDIEVNGNNQIVGGGGYGAADF
jgi:RHS repeat-associated protein